MTSHTTRSERTEQGLPKKILCAVDLSEFAAPVLAHAVALARYYTAEVAAVHVLAEWAPPASLATYPGWMMQIPEAREVITKELRTLVEPFAAGGSPVRLHASEGDAAKEIVRYADEWGADLLVIGTHGRSGFDRFALGSVAEKVLRKASCPVLTLPPRAPRTVSEVAYRQILCPTDFSDCAENALDFAVTLAQRADAAVTALHVIEALDGEQELKGPGYVAEFRRLQCEGARDSLHELASARVKAGCRIAELVVLGRPYREILRVATEHQADVIVMGVRGRGPIDLTLFGSTTNQVVRRATHPVITVRSQ